MIHRLQFYPAHTINLKKYEVCKRVYEQQIYLDRLKNYQLGISTSDLSPAAGMRMSASDLARFMLVQMNYGEYNGIRLLKKESVLELWRPQGADRSYAWGFGTFVKIVEGENSRV